MNSLDSMLQHLLGEAALELLLRAGNRPTVRASHGQLVAVPGTTSLTPASMASLLRGTPIAELIPKATVKGLHTQLELSGQPWHVSVTKRGVDLQVTLRVPSPRRRPVASPSSAGRRLQLKTPVPTSDTPDDGNAHTHPNDDVQAPQRRDVPIPTQPLTGGDDALSKIFGRGLKSAGNTGSAGPAPQEPQEARRDEAPPQRRAQSQRRAPVPRRPAAEPQEARSTQPPSVSPQPGTEGLPQSLALNPTPIATRTDIPAPKPPPSAAAAEPPIARPAHTSPRPQAPAPPSLTPGARRPQRRYTTVALPPQARKQLLATASSQPHPHLVSCAGFGRSLGASDVVLVANQPMHVRRQGRIERHGEPLPDGALEQMLESVISPAQSELVDTKGHARFTATLGQAGPVRFDVSLAADGLQATIRLLPASPIALDQLGAPVQLAESLRSGAGLVLIVSPAGHGKSATLAGAVHHINTNQNAHILHLEDSASLVHQPIQSLITQRAMGVHCAGWTQAIAASSGLSVDVVAIDSLRSGRAVEAALSAASTGKLVVATMNGTSGTKAMETLIDKVPAERQHSARQRLARNLRAVVFQRLFGRADGSGQIAAWEMVIGSPALARMIRESKLQQLPGLMQRGRKQGMRRLEDSVRELLAAGTITPEDARPYLLESRSSAGRSASEEGQALHGGEDGQGDSLAGSDPKTLADRVGGLFRRKK